MRSLLQFTLDLFDPPAAVPAPLQETPTPAAPTMVLPLQTLEQALSPVTFRHPQASREILLDGCLVAYAFKRSRRRTIGFSVGVDGLSVSAPAWAPLRDVEAALREKSGWIVRKLGEMRERGSRMEAARIDGIGEFRLFTKIMLPLAKPIAVVLAIFSFQWRWNDYIWPLLVLRDPDRSGGHAQGVRRLLGGQPGDHPQSQDFLLRPGQAAEQLVDGGGGRRGHHELFGAAVGGRRVGHLGHRQ